MNANRSDGYLSEQCWYDWCDDCADDNCECSCHYEGVTE